jgi:hypothetical protein
MGQPAAVVFACLFMSALEDDWLTKWNNSLFYYKRFIDDGTGLFLGSKEECKIMLEEYNSLHADIKIKYEISDEMTVFLDLEIYLKNSRLFTRLYQKPMNKYLYVPASSYHHKHTLSAYISGELKRYIRVCSEHSFYLEARRKFYFRLRARGYTKLFLTSIFQSVSYDSRESLLSSNQIKKDNNLFLIIEKNTLTDHIRLDRFFARYWFGCPGFQAPANAANSPVWRWLLEQNRPTVGTRYQPSLGKRLMRSRLDGFLPVADRSPAIIPNVVAAEDSQSALKRARTSTV